MRLPPHTHDEGRERCDVPCRPYLSDELLDAMLRDLPRWESDQFEKLEDGVAVDRARRGPRP